MENLKITLICDTFNYDELKNAVLEYNSINNDLQNSISIILSQYKNYILKHNIPMISETHYYNVMENNINFVMLEYFNTKYLDEYKKTYYIFVYNAINDEIMGIYAIWYDETIIKTYDNINDFEKWIFNNLFNVAIKK